MLLFSHRWLLLTIYVAYLYKIPLAKTEDIKTWSPNTNFLNPRNWRNGQLPCENDRVVFPASSPVITLMPKSLTVGKMVLPVDGEIIFPDNATIEFTGGDREGACIGREVHFLPIVDYWYDPISWNITSEAAFPRIPNRKNAAVPHTFQVPCPLDRVRFPDQTTFQCVHLYPGTVVSAIEMNGVSYTNSKFRELLRTHVGSLLFPNRPNIHIVRSVCRDETGCQCFNEKPEVMPTICAQVTPYCPSLECSDPVTPVGSCCPICGVQILIQFKPNFKMSRLLTLHDQFLSKEEFRGVESFTAKLYDGDIQSVLVDGDKYKGRANKVAQLIHDALSSDMTGSQLYKIKSITVYKSENWNSGVPTYDQLTRGMSSGGVAALVIVTIIGLGLAAAFYIYKRRQIPGFNFARFDLRGDKIELELGTTPHDELQPNDPPQPSGSEKVKSKGFDNPVYGTSVEEEIPAAEPLVDTKDFVENPMFMIFEDSSKHADGENVLE